MDTTQWLTSKNAQALVSLVSWCAGCSVVRHLATCTGWRTVAGFELLHPPSDAAPTRANGLSQFQPFAS